MRPNDVRQLVQVKMPVLRRQDRVLRDCFNVAEYCTAAKRTLPAGIFDYLEGGAEDETTMRRNQEVFKRWGLIPSWGPVADLSTSTTILGRTVALPLTLTPTGASRLFHPDGESAVALAANTADIPYTLAGLGTVSMGQIAQEQPDLDRWFNVSLSPDKGAMQTKLDQCTESGYRAIVVNVDTRALGSRERDRRSGFTAPPTLTLASLLGVAIRPVWWTNFLRAEGIRFPNLDASVSLATPSMWEQILGHSEASQGWDDVVTLRSAWPGKIVLKGTVNPSDVVRARDLGIDAVQLSNHGGRQLDHTASPMDVLQETRQLVGNEIEIYVDSGIRRGSDIVKAIALGADACSIGRPYLYGLAAAGTAGVSAVIDILAEEFRRTMALVGVSSVAQIKTLGHDIVRELHGPLQTKSPF